MNNPEILLVKNKDIDYPKWDQCIANSLIPLVYAQSWYLDIVSPDWDALIYGDYQHVMPLPIKRKVGFSFILQPFFAQQLGVFPKVDLLIQNKFLVAVRDRFNYVALNINAGHNEPFPEGFTVEPRINYILQLILPYQEIKNNYSIYTQSQLRKAQPHKITVIKGSQSQEYLKLKKSASKVKLSEASMKTLKRIIEMGHTRGNGVIYAAYDSNNMLCAAAFFLFAGHRVTYLNAISTDEGKKMHAMFRIVDHFIQEHAGSLLTLDFEGSMIRGIAKFYQGFGAASEQYYFLKSNKLPVPLRWLKK